MSNVGNVSGASGATMSAMGEISGISPDALLEYCQMQLGGLDKEMKTQMDQQSLELQEREAVESAQTTLESFGTTGPQSVADFQTCENAMNSAAASLPAGDPVGKQLLAAGQTMATQYGYSAPQTLTPAQQQQLAPYKGLYMLSQAGVAVGVFIPPGALKLAQAQNGSLTKPPSNNDWQGTTDSLGNMADGIKSGAEIQMLKLQDLVSQRQQAVQLASGMMSTENQTLQSEVKNIGG